MANPLDTKETKAHCNTCGGERNHKVLCSDKSTWEDEDYTFWSEDTYEMIKCCGCDSIKLRHSELCTNDIQENNTVVPRTQYYPPAMFRPHPKWLFDLILAMDVDEDNIYGLLNEIYVALRNDQRTIAAMGIRALLEYVMVKKVNDNGSFAANLKAFEANGYVSSRQRERLETILEAGHAAMHRLYKPLQLDLITLVDITESIIESIYIHDSKVERLKSAIPPRIRQEKG